MHAKKSSIESCRWPPRSARFSVRKKCVVCFWLNLTKSKFSLFRLSNNLCCHWCWSLCSRTYPNPSKNTKSDPKSLTRIALHRISCGSACLTQVRPSPFWGAPRTVVKPRASSPLFLLAVHNTPFWSPVQRVCSKPEDGWGNPCRNVVLTQTCWCRENSKLL